GSARLDGLNLTPEDCTAIHRIVIVPHATITIRWIAVQVEYASEYRYRRPLVGPGTLTLAISQSGETADTLEALRAAKAAGSRVIGIVNVVGSTIAREADGGIYLHAGPEIGGAPSGPQTAGGWSSSCSSSRPSWPAHWSWRPRSSRWPSAIGTPATRCIW